MAKLVYSVMMSLDGFVADVDGQFDWAVPDDEVHAFVNDLERPIGTYLYGRRMYETMRYWENVPELDAQPGVVVDYASIWRSADKVVYSTTLTSVDTARTRIEPTFDRDGIKKLKHSSQQDISIGGPTLASHALEAGLVDECHLLIAPVVVGAGRHFLGDGTQALSLELVSERRFGNGVVHVHYLTR